MQTLRLTHRLDLGLIGVSGDTIVKLPSEMWSPKWRQRSETIFGVNLKATNIILCLQLGDKTKNRFPKTILMFYLYHPIDRSSP